LHRKAQNYWAFSFLRAKTTAKNMVVLMVVLPDTKEAAAPNKNGKSFLD